jgi:hypothetical protein
VLDSAGAVVRTMRARARAGANRLSWDLRYDGPKQIELRTTPPDNPDIWNEPRFKRNPTRPINHWGIQNPQRTGPVAPPGRFTVRVKLDSTSAPATQSFRVMKDPKIVSTDADLFASTAAQVRIRDDINTTVDIVNRLEIMRKQIEDHRKSETIDNATQQALGELDKKMLDVELKLLTPSDLHSDDKWYVEQYRVYLNLLWLAGEVGTGAGDVAGGAEYRPTDASMSVLTDIERDLSTARTAFASFMEKDLPAFNASMSGKIPAITDKLPEKKPAAAVLP